MLTHRFAHRSARAAGIVLALLLILTTPALAAFTPGNGQAATLVLGQPNFTSHAVHTTQNGMNLPYAVAVDPATHKVFVAEYNNNRVLRFTSVYALKNGAAAEAVLGQPNFTSNTSHATQNGMSGPLGLFVDAGGRLWVADYNNNRTLRFDHAATLSSGANANGVLGQANFISNTTAINQHSMSAPCGVFVDAGGRLWVTDYNNNRVLRFDNAASKANGANADGVLGQTSFTSNGTATSQNGLHGPFYLAVDASGRLWVTDAVNNRVLRFDNAASKANGANADGVLGQPDFTNLTPNLAQNGLAHPSGITVDNATGRLYVGDYNSNRVLVFNGAAGLANGANASSVLGQNDFTSSSSGTSAITLNGPIGAFFDPVSKVLLAVDSNNNRVLMYGSPFTSFSVISTAANDGWVLASSTANNAGGSKSATGTFRLGDDASNRQYRSILSFNTSALPDNAVIHSVTLKILKAGALGTDPLTSNSLGSLLADIKKGSFGASALEVGDFQATASASAVGHFSSISAGWYQVVLPASDFTYVNLSGLTQFRLRFSTASNNNHVADYDSFYAGDATTAANRPALIVQYYLP